MRAKKLILLVDPDEDRAGVTRFVLSNDTRFRVISAASTEEGFKAARKRRPDLVLGYAPVDQQQLMELAYVLGCPWQLIAPNNHFWPAMCVVLERIKTATARRKGPKPQPLPARVGVAA